MEHFSIDYKVIIIGNKLDNIENILKTFINHRIILKENLYQYCNEHPLIIFIIQLDNDIIYIIRVINKYIKWCKYYITYLEHITIFYCQLYNYINNLNSIGKYITYNESFSIYVFLI